MTPEQTADDHELAPAGSSKSLSYGAAVQSGSSNLTHDGVTPVAVEEKMVQGENVGVASTYADKVSAWKTMMVV